MTFTFHAPQIIWIAICVAGISWAAVDHGKPCKGKDNVWVTLSVKVLLTALLYWGGFFRQP